MTVWKKIGLFIKALKEHLGQVWFPLAMAGLIFATLSLVGLAAGQVQEMLANYIVTPSEPWAGFKWLRAVITVLSIWMLAAVLVDCTTVLFGVRLRDLTSIRDLTLWQGAFVAITWITPWLGAAMSFFSAHCQSTFGLGGFELIKSPFSFLAAFALIFPSALAFYWWRPKFRAFRERVGKGATRQVWHLGLPILFVVLTITFYAMAPWAILFAREVGPITLACVSLSAIAAAGTWLIRWSRARNLPAFTIVAFLPLAIGMFGCDDNHFIRQLAPSATAQRPKLTEALTAFAGANSRSNEPIVIVSTEGGGVRAAEFTAMVLSRLADQCPRFARRIFSISGVSGGSMGAAVYRASLEVMPLEGDGCDLDAARPPGPRELALNDVFARDHLSPVLAKQAFPELVQLFVPASFPGAGGAWFAGTDRQLGLEFSFEQAFRDAFHIASDAPSPFEASAFGQGGLAPPYLLLNTTETSNGEPYVVGGLNLTDVRRQDPWLTDWRCAWGEDVNDDNFRCETSPDFRLSTMAGTSARFVAVSPAGTIRAEGGRRLHFVDGGYFDNSGIEANLAMLDHLRQVLKIENPRLLASLPRRIVLLHINSNPPSAAIARTRLDFDVHELGAVLATREARVRMSFNQLDNEEIYGDVCRLMPVFLRRQPDVPLRLGWILSARASQEMQRQAALYWQNAARDGDLNAGECANDE